jgi:hypothetical protein
VGTLALTRHVSWDCLVSYHGNRYSVPAAYAGKMVWLVVSHGTTLVVLSSRRDVPFETGATCSATRSSPPPFSTGYCTSATSSRSTAQATVSRTSWAHHRRQPAERAHDPVAAEPVPISDRIYNRHCQTGVGNFSGENPVNFNAKSTGVVALQGAPLTAGPRRPTVVQWRRHARGLYG